MKLVEGITYTHEHVTIDLSGIKKDDDCNLNCYEETLTEFKELKSKGVNNIIDVTNRGMGRNIEYMVNVSRETDMNILFSTGYYKEPFLPKEAYDLDEKHLSKLMVSEIINGVEGSKYKASIIGEIGTSKDKITEMEHKVFVAGALAHVETGTPIITHTTLGTLGLEQIDLFNEFKVDLNKVIISHVDLSGNLDYILRMIDRGVNVAFDTIGKENYQPDGLRIDFLKEICSRGLSDRVLLSMDITRKSNFRTRGGIGYAYLIDTFIPLMIEKGIKQKDIDKMTRSNIVRILG